MDFDNNCIFRPSNRQPTKFSGNFISLDMVLTNSEKELNTLNASSDLPCLFNKLLICTQLCTVFIDPSGKK